MSDKDIMDKVLSVNTVTDSTDLSIDLSESTVVDWSDITVDVSSMYPTIMKTKGRLITGVLASANVYLEAIKSIALSTPNKTARLLIDYYRLQKHDPSNRKLLKIKTELEESGILVE